MTLTIQISNDGARQIAECAGIKVVKTKGGTIHELCRKLQEAGHDPATPVEVRRGNTLCFSQRPVSNWADTMLYEGNRGFRLVKWDYDAMKNLRNDRLGVSDEA